MNAHDREVQAELKEKEMRLEDQARKDAALANNKVLRYLQSVLTNEKAKAVDKKYWRIDVKFLWVDEHTSQEHYRVNFWEGNKIGFSTFLKMWGEEGISDPEVCEIP